VLGSGTGATLVALGAAYFLRNNRFAVLQLGFLLLCATVSMDIAKTFVERLRPESLLWVDPLNTYSFPSGHATLATALYAFIGVCLYRRLRSPLPRFLATAACALLVLLVCASRLVLSAHYFTDVLAGMLLGLFWLAVVFMLPRPR
jgi:undecaprenyl-diphosphatase